MHTSKFDGQVINLTFTLFADLVKARFIVGKQSTCPQRYLLIIFPLRIIGSLVLVVVAVQLFRNAQKSNLEARQVSKDFNRNSLATFATFFGLTVINPATAFYFLAITPSVAQVSVGSGLSGNVLYFALGVFTGSVIWQFSLVFSAHFMSKRMTLKVQRALQYSGAALIALLSIWLIFKSVDV